MRYNNYSRWSWEEWTFDKSGTQCQELDEELKKVKIITFSDLVRTVKNKESISQTSESVDTSTKQSNKTTNNIIKNTDISNFTPRMILFSASHICHQLR